MKLIVSTLALLSAAAMFSSPVQADPARAGSCGDDTKTLCAQAAQQGSGAVLDCLKQHSTQLSAGCAATMQRVPNLPAGYSYSNSISPTPLGQPQGTGGGDTGAGAGGNGTAPAGGGNGAAPSN
jgi:hypothetical protein